MDPITNTMKKTSGPSYKLILKRIFSIFVISCFLGLVIFLVAKIFLFRATLDPTGWGPKLCGLVNALQIKIMNFIYKRVALALNRWENYETDS